MLGGIFFRVQSPAVLLLSLVCCMFVFVSGLTYCSITPMQALQQYARFASMQLAAHVTPTCVMSPGAACHGHVGIFMFMWVHATRACHAHMHVSMFMDDASHGGSKPNAVCFSTTQVCS